MVVMFAAFLASFGCGTLILYGIICCGKKRKTQRSKEPGGNNSKPQTSKESGASAPMAPPGATTSGTPTAVSPDSRDENSPVPSPSAEKRDCELKPKQMPLNEKEEMIARGQKTSKNDYPTMEDVLSDWNSDSNDGDEKEKKKSKSDDKGKKERKKKKHGPRRKKSHKNSLKERSRKSHKSKRGKRKARKKETNSKSDESGD
ncbi:hypothetical protein L596_022067 [Steinernema carpocapsae]|uniref:Uncharacterized protein n=1 Tax=Steinernema carpocapsae TaxID=34508 RepID=A0A4U5MKN0_STECR|nr:hypothetical protein L596_022067 [Steinernema carpocapsae]